MDIRIKRAYEDPAAEDGTRILVDRLWPRGLSKEKAKIDDWPKEIAPSDELRRWYGHDPEKWDEFCSRYFDELQDRPEQVEKLREQARQGRVTFVFSSKEEKLNNAVALKEYLEGGE